MNDLDLTFWPYLREAGSFWHGFSAEGDAPEAWFWLPGVRVTLPSSLETTDQLLAAGWQSMDPENRMSKASGQYLRMFSQLRDVRLVGDESADQELWARTEDVLHCNREPVTLAFTLHNFAPELLASQSASGAATLSIATMLPPPQFGEIGLVHAERDGRQVWQRYTINALGEAGLEIQSNLSAALLNLADPSGWWPLSPEIQSEIEERNGRGAAILDALQWALAHRETWLQKWGEIQVLAQQLSAAYWKAHKAAKPSTQIPAITSAHRTMLPSSNAWRGIIQSFGPVIMPSLWDDTEADNGGEKSNRVLVLETPNGSSMRLQGRSELETAALQHYIWTMLGPEGLKHTIGLIDAYHSVTGGRDQKTDAHVTPRGLLKHIGAANPDDPEDQRKLTHTILYLSRCGIVAEEKIDDPEAYKRRTGRRTAPKEIKKWTPLLVIEGFDFTDGKLKTLESIDFHLGREFYNALFGEGQSFFTIPTAVVFGYHGERQQHELLLSVYLSNMIVMNAGKGSFSCHFPVLAQQTALATEQEMERSKHRLRDATRVLRALEQLERDSLILREPHRDIDTIHTVDLVLSEVSEADLAAATLNRVRRSVDYQVWCRERDKGEVNELALKARRRQAIQRLLQGRTAGNMTAITFSAGPLLQEQTRKREAGRKAAQERDERARDARITQNVLTNVSKRLGASVPNPGGKRRGRPLKRAK